MERRDENQRDKDKGVGERNKEAKNKKTRRSKTIRNKLSSFTLYYINIRDLKCKRKSFEEIISELQPTVIAVTETWWDDSNELKIEGYEVYPNGRNEDGGGVMIAVRNEIKHITTELKKTKEKFESLWVVINNTRIKLRIGILSPGERCQRPRFEGDIRRIETAGTGCSAE